MKNSIAIVLLLIPGLLFAQGARQSALLTESTFSAVDANGRTVTLDDSITTLMIAGKAGNMPANALFLFPEVGRMQLTLPKTDQGLGDFFALIREDLDEQSRLSQTASVEEIAARNADIVLMKATHFESMGKKLDQLGVPNFTMSLETWDEWQRELIQLGILLGNSARADEIIGMYQQRIDLIETRSHSIEKPMRLLLLQADRKDNTTSYKVAPDDWLQTWMVQTIGAEPVWEGTNKAAAGWSTVSFEQIAAWDPDLIVLISYSTPTRSYLEGIYASPTWQKLKAVQNKTVLASPHDLMNYVQPVASWILGLTWLAKETYPTLYTDIDMATEVDHFYRSFYGITDPAILELLVETFEESVALNRL
ncbi:MAG: ABC transporter substrate-binding protein [Sphaerochaeta sp.]|jgi:iron complex transport system substrate-binding protein